MRPVLSAAGVLVRGLGSAGSGRSRTGLSPVPGTVVYRGVPIPSGRIVFVPDSRRGSTGPIAGGEIAPDGAYHLQTGEVHGAPAGWYRVTVAAVEFTPDGTPRSLLPERY